MVYGQKQEDLEREEISELCIKSGIIPRTRILKLCDSVGRRFSEQMPYHAFVRLSENCRINPVN